MPPTSRMTLPRAGAEDALRRIVEGTSAATGREFFRSLARNLAGVLGYRYALVGELVSPKPARVHTLAVWDEEGEVSGADGIGSGIGSGFGSAFFGEFGSGSGPLAPAGGAATTPAGLVGSGRFHANFDFLVANTPADYVVGKKPCHYPQAVRRLFPEDATLERLGVESFLGVPLTNAAGHPLGLLALMGDSPSDSAAAAEAQSILRTFAPRA